MATNTRMYKQEMNAVATGIVLIASDSIVGGFDDKRLGRKNKVKVRCFPGATINNVLLFETIIREKPDYIILHVSTTITKTLEVILNELMELIFEKTLPSCIIIISEPTIRLDSAKASLLIKHINEKL